MPKVMLLAVIFLALSLFIYVLVTSSEQDMAKLGISPGSFMEDVSVVNRDSGALQWSLMTKRALISKDGGSAKMQDVTLTLHSEDMTVLANSGLYNIDSNDLFLSGDVNAETDNYTIKTDTAILKNETLSTNSKVMIEGQGFRIEGTGLKAFQKKVTLQNDVTAVFH
jgi:LPS export ABC transporter protein LptC